MNQECWVRNRVNLSMTQRRKISLPESFCEIRREAQWTPYRVFQRQFLFPVR